MGRFDGNAIVIDVSSYEPNSKMADFKAAGATHVILRMGYQNAYNAANWQLTEDSCYRKWFDEAKSAGLWVGGYYLYCAGVDEQDYEHSEGLLTHMGEIMANGYKPDFLMIDDEVNTWWDGARKITATAVNQVKGARILIDKSWKKFAKVTGHYSRVTFMKQRTDYELEYKTWLDNINRIEKVVPNWYAYYWYYKQNLNPSSLTALISVLTYPTSVQENSYLQMGSYSLWDLWQFAGDVVTPWGKCDISVSRLPVKEFNALFNIGDAVTPPPVDPPPPPPAGQVTRAEFDAALARVAELERWRKS